ncbi:glycosyl hydrolase 43 family protein [Propioniciclava coleopterorum]|uniref:Glycosyl hydrolase 43 family protein n=1 Tax=Propioniciclava coleopterorum TaxID=2714937 RepID=A0A6G7Y319_9ACTN|nr:glycoside hydrolase 43 family protein [Propioniciclava coleopterorum]QIK71173.1 glycosyl hydrolase 43 family protein [Propioniciclava coleopterorum]
MIPYANPILDSDFPDPDVTRFGDSFVLVASSFNRTPGLPILTSDNLVDWSYASHALAAVPPAVGHFDLPRRGGGVWAPSIRTHEGRLVVVYPDPDHGIFVTTAPAPQGPWTEPHLLIPGQGLIDPCPLWDDDGRAYLVFGWARSRAGFKNRLSVVEVDPGLTTPIGPLRTVIDGDAIEGMITVEGPKFYRRDGWYWIFAPAGGVATGHQVVFRSRSVWGPYEHRIVLEQGDSPVNGPHQGGWVTAPDGSDWFVHFQDRGPYGRVVHLQPMGWGADGWPWMGDEGTPVLTWPRGAETRPASAGEPDRADDFTGPLNPAWHWQATPGADWARCAGGVLSLELVPHPTTELRTFPGMLGQSLPGYPCEVEVEVDLDADAPDGSRAGLAVFGHAYAFVGLERRAGATYAIRVSSAELGAETVEEAVACAGPLRVRLVTDAAARVTLGAQGAGAALPEATFQATEAHWIGSDLCLFAQRPIGTPAARASFTGWRLTRI